MRPPAILAALALPLAGCGSKADYKNEPRPPSPIVVAGSISPKGVSVSPKRFGAGPINLVIANQTTTSQRITLTGDDLPGAGCSIEQQTGPINPRETASLKADVPEGTCVVRVDDDGIKPAKLEVGAPRPTSQNDLLQP